MALRRKHQNFKLQGLNSVGASGNCWRDSSPWWLRQVEVLQPSPTLAPGEQVAPRHPVPAAKEVGENPNNSSHDNEALVHNPGLSYYCYLWEDFSPINS